MKVKFYYNGHNVELPENYTVQNNRIFNDKNEEMMIGEDNNGVWINKFWCQTLNDEPIYCEKALYIKGFRLSQKNFLL